MKGRKPKTPSNNCPVKWIPSVTVTINLERRTAEEKFEHSSDELVFNLNEDSVDEILASIKPTIERGDFHSAFISIDRETIDQEEWESLGDDRGFFEPDKEVIQ